MTLSCILCQSRSPIFFQDQKQEKDYYQCQVCSLIFLNPNHRLSFADENARYLIHENNPDDAGYQNYLQPVRDIIHDKFNLTDFENSPLQVLDFGSGPHSALAPLLAHLPVQYYAYDPYFKNDLNLLEQQYDAVAVTEVIEHLREPAKTISQLKNLTHINGYIIFMTQFFTEKIDFKSWHYRRDPTHIAFYSKPTMNHIKEQFGLSVIEFIGDRVACFKI